MDKILRINNKRPSNDKTITVLVSFKTVCDILDNKYLDNPDIQIDLDIGKVDKMVKAYKKKPFMLRFKKVIAIGIILTDDKKQYMLIDGQHRLQMAKKLFTEHHIDDELMFECVKLENQKELNEIFSELNEDSAKAGNLPILSVFKQKKIIELKTGLKKEYIGLMTGGNRPALSEKDNESRKCYSVSEFVNKLESTGYFDDEISVEDMIIDLKKANDLFFSSFGYIDKKNDKSEYFYSEEIKCIDNKVCMFFKRNNFMSYFDAISRDKQIDPAHNLRPIRGAVTSAMCKQVWEDEFDNASSGTCPVVLCKNTIYLKDKDRDGYDDNNTSRYVVGHIISVKHGGATTINNLRPICSSCNSKMYDTDWNVYEEKKLFNHIRDIYEDEYQCICKKTIIMNKINTYKPVKIPVNGKQNKFKYVPRCVKCCQL